MELELGHVRGYITRLRESTRTFIEVSDPYKEQCMGILSEIAQRNHLMMIGFDGGDKILNRQKANHDVAHGAPPFIYDCEPFAVSMLFTDTCEWNIGRPVIYVETDNTATWNVQQMFFQTASNNVRIATIHDLHAIPPDSWDIQNCVEIYVPSIRISRRTDQSWTDVSAELRHQFPALLRQSHPIVRFTTRGLHHRYSGFGPIEQLMVEDDSGKFRMGTIEDRLNSLEVCMRPDAD